jgi:hypothetical protein
MRQNHIKTRPINTDFSIIAVTLIALLLVRLILTP